MATTEQCDGWTLAAPIGAVAILMRTTDHFCASFQRMAGLRTLVRTRWFGRLLTVGVAYLLVAEAFIASVGIGMSAESALALPEFAICSSVMDEGLVAPSDNEQNKSGHQSQCPFCFVAAQSDVHLATIGDTLASPAYAEFQIAGLLYGAYNCATDIRCFYRTSGAPRGPPQFSV